MTEMQLSNVYETPHFSSADEWYDYWLNKLSQYDELCFDISAGLDTRILTGFIKPLKEKGLTIYFYNNPYKFNFNKKTHIELDGREVPMEVKKQQLINTNSYGFDALGYVFGKMLDLQECRSPVTRVRGRRKGPITDKSLYPLYGIDDEQRREYLKFIPNEFRIFPVKSKTDQDPYFIL